MAQLNRIIELSKHKSYSAYVRRLNQVFEEITDPVDRLFVHKKLLATANSELVKGVNIIRTNILRSMKSTPRASWFYMRGKKKHYPSKPGSPPAIDSGELIRSIVTDADALDMSVEVGALSGAPYAENLEDEDGLNRPWLSPEVDSYMPTLERRVVKSLTKELDRW